MDERTRRREHAELTEGRVDLLRASDDRARAGLFVEAWALRRQAREEEGLQVQAARNASALPGAVSYVDPLARDRLRDLLRLLAGPPVETATGWFGLREREAEVLARYAAGLSVGDRVEVGGQPARVTWVGYGRLRDQRRYRVGVKFLDGSHDSVPGRDAKRLY